MATPHAEEVLSVHLRVPSPAPRGCIACVCVCVYVYVCVCACVCVSVRVRLHCIASEAHLVHGRSGYARLRDR